jgi:hypothetical protein
MALAQAEFSPALASAAGDPVEGEIRNLVRAELPSIRRLPEAPSLDASGGQVAAAIGRISATSLVEVDALIRELDAARRRLADENAHIRAELERFSHLCLSASDIAKRVSGSLQDWRKRAYAR